MASVGIESKKILRRVYNAIQEDFFNSEIVILDSASEKIWRTKQPLTEEELFLITEKYPGSPWLDSLKDFDFKNLRKSRISERRGFYLEEHFGYIRFAVWECSQYIAAQYVRENGKQIVEDGRITTIDLEKLIAKHNETAVKMVSKYPVPERYKLV